MYGASVHVFIPITIRKSGHPVWMSRKDEVRSRLFFWTENTIRGRDTLLLFEGGNSINCSLIKYPAVTTGVDTYICKQLLDAGDFRTGRTQGKSVRKDARRRRSLCGLYLSVLSLRGSSSSRLIGLNDGSIA